MARQISLAHLTVLDTTPPELVTVAAAAGFNTIGIRLTATPSVGVPPYTDEMLRSGPLLRETLRRLEDTGVSVLDTEFLRFEPDQPVGIPEGFLEVSARLGAKNVLVMSAEEDGRTLERFCELCDRAATYGLQVGLEFAIYTGVRTLAHAAEVVARSKRANASVLIDALHFSRSGGRPAHVASVDPSLLRYAQICDAGPDMPGPGDTSALIREARTGRLLPGEGVLPLVDLVAALPESAPLAIEAPCRDTAHLPALERAKRAHQALSALVERVAERRHDD
ncbi:MAG TPA: TIM barrel protein [Candidatus Acidoferrum sp.]|nr:TIM barrel protein [Candidatus Acidoferrum sp.]